MPFVKGKAYETQFAKFYPIYGIVFSLFFYFYPNFLSICLTVSNTKIFKSNTITNISNTLIHSSNT